MKGIIPDGMHSSLAFNRNKHRGANEGSHQYGGVAVITVGQLSHSVDQRGQDPSGLGRWAWTTIRGRGGAVLRVVAAYRPNPPGEGDSTVWWQHRAWLLAQGDEREPRQAFMEDLCSALQTWLQDGDHIVLGMDANDDLRKGEVTRTLERLGLEERILQRHRDRAPQATYHRNTKGKPIDGIFSSFPPTLLLFPSSSSVNNIQRSKDCTTY